MLERMERKYMEKISISKDTSPFESEKFEKELFKYGSFKTIDIWRYYLDSEEYDLPEYGFKIHVSSTYVTAIQILNLILPILVSKRVKFKVIKDIDDLIKLNRGEYGYSQIGKMVTIYPRNSEELNELLELLYIKTILFNSVEIPSDFRYKNSKTIFYRYGELVESKDNKKWKDLRIKKIPHDVTVPIKDYYHKRYPTMPNHYFLLENKNSRGKSRVYTVLDKRDSKIKIMKQGLFLGEFNSIGKDGFSNVMKEFEVLEALAYTGAFPKLYEFFYLGDSFVIIEEYIKGATLREHLKKRDIELLSVLRKILKYIKVIYKENHIIGDLSPSNIIINENHDIVFIDTEFYQRLGEPSLNFIGTPGFYSQKYNGEKQMIFSFLSLILYSLYPEEYKDMISSNNTEGYTPRVEKILNGKDEKEFFDLSLSEQLKWIESILSTP